MALEKLSTSPILSDDHISRLRNPDLLTQLTLDVSWYINKENFDSKELGSFELNTREYLHRLHVKRVVALRSSSEPTKTVISYCIYLLHQVYIIITSTELLLYTSQYLRSTDMCPKLISGGALRYNNNNNDMAVHNVIKVEIKQTTTVK